MITKHELLTFVEQIPDVDFHDEVSIAKRLYTRCCDEVVILTITPDDMKFMEYDVLKDEKNILAEVTEKLISTIDVDALVEEALEELDEEDNV